MRIYSIPQTLRQLATAVSFIFLVSCGTGEGPESVPDTAIPPPPPVVTATSPDTPAPTPTARSAADVISMFSAAYANVAVDTWNAGFSSGSLSTPDFMVMGDAVKEYQSLGFSGIETTTTPLDVSGMTNFSMDIWTPADTSGGQEFKVKWVDTGPNGMVEFPSMDNTESELTFTSSTMPALVTGSWVTIDVPLSDFTGLGPLTQLAQLIISGNLSTVYIDNVYFYNASGSAGGELLINGTFEAGDTAGWTLISNDGTFTATMDQATGPGVWSGNLVASVPSGGGPASFPVATQPNTAVGTVTPNQSVTVSFDFCGEVTGAGGVVQTALLSEIAGGGASKTDALFGNITPTATWTQYTMTTLTGSDVSGGLTLQLKSDCGGNPGCTVNAYFDNVSVVLDSDVGNVSGAGGACPATPPPPAPDGLPVDFEDAGGPYTFGDFGGGTTTIINNPDMTGNSSAKVVQMQKFMDQTFGGTTLTLDGPIDFSTSQIITMKVWSQRVANVEFKVEGQPGNVTVIQPTSGISGGVWETLTFDFTGLISDPVSAVSIFFDNGILGDAAGDPTNWTFYFDDIQLDAPPPPVMVLPVDFEDAGGPYTFGDFGGGTTTIINNPDMTGNSSAKVVQMQKFMDQTFGGTTLTLDGPIDFSTSQVIAMKVWSQRVVNVEFKVEGQTGNVTVIQPTSGTPGGIWETLIFDFSGQSLDPVSAVSIFFDNGILGDAAGDPVNWTFYFDDIDLGSPSPPPTGGNLVANGDFEAGDISGWADFSAANNGAFAATMAQANGGFWSGNLTASVPGGGGPASFPVVKQANIGIGTVTPSTDMFISFDLSGSVSGAGGVFFAEFFSELTGGGTSSAVILGGGPIFPSGSWTTYTFSSPTGADVSGGVTLQLKADCGGNPGCTVDAFIDNVCVSSTPGLCF